MLVADYQVLTDRDTAERLDDYVLRPGAGLPGDRDRPGTHDDLRAQRVPALNQLLLPFLSLVSVPS